MYQSVNEQRISNALSYLFTAHCRKMTRRHYALCVKFNIIPNTQPHGSLCHYVFLKFIVHWKRCNLTVKIFKSVSVLLIPRAVCDIIILYLKNKNLSCVLEPYPLITMHIILCFYFVEPSVVTVGES